MMELWASGFNAWGQLDFELPQTGPRDLKAFKCILRDERIEILCTSLSATLGKPLDGPCFDYVYGSLFENQRTSNFGYILHRVTKTPFLLFTYLPFFY